MADGWQFSIDRGGTFTDVVARAPDGALVVHKLLSEAPERYKDAALQGIRDILGVKADQPLPLDSIDAVRMGTTLATNALLERKGARTLLATTAGFRDALRIAYQNRPDIFALKITLPELVYEQVVEVEERIDAHGKVLKQLDSEDAREKLKQAYQQGIRACAILLMHGYRYPQHEQALASLAVELGFTQISVSHEVIPLMKFVSRGDTTTVDAYLTPVIRNYIDSVSSQLKDIKLFFMQSSGGLSAAGHFRGKDSILSGPAGGMIGAMKTALAAGERNIISFDMGGTSTDVAHYSGELERSNENEIAGVRMRAPMLAIHTVAAGGGSILTFDGARFRVGPGLAGANPGPACYRRGGPLTVTDCNVLLGRIQPDLFPKVFGPAGDEPLDRLAVSRLFDSLSETVHASTGVAMELTDIAFGFLSIAVERMATAIKRVSTQKGHDPSDYALACFGGAGGQHACMIAESLGIKRILIHPLAGVLSAYGIGLADVTVIKESPVETTLEQSVVDTSGATMRDLEALARKDLAQQVSSDAPITIRCIGHIRYDASDFSIPVAWNDAKTMADDFCTTHRRRYGFNHQYKALILERISLEATAPTQYSGSMSPAANTHSGNGRRNAHVYFPGGFLDVPLHHRDTLKAGQAIPGPAMIVEPTSTIIVEPAWEARILDDGSIAMTAVQSGRQNLAAAPEAEQKSKPHPVLLEVFNNLFMFIAEQMGVTLQNTSHSVNIKERLDFSCALFDEHGNLVANAPHMPVHLGSMGESVQELILKVGNKLRPGDVYALNDPYNGGTHLPDITVIGAYFHNDSGTPLFYVAARGHHADIGGITPGSMPPFSKSLHEEGVLLSMVKVASQERLFETELLTLFSTGRYPSRNPTQNVADLSAQVAAVRRGLREIARIVEHHGLSTVRDYMHHVQDNAEESVRRLISSLNDGAHVCKLDSGARIAVQVKIDRRARSAVIDFSDSSPQSDDNFNAPRSICKAAVLYVFRTLVDQDIPLNAGCLKPLNIIIPEHSLLNPSYPAAVVAGNVETSQVIVDTLYAALGKQAASQGTMNNFTFGNDKYQYYETISGGSGAGPGYDGADVVQTHMTNSRLTDPEVLEWRFPVLVEEFTIRQDSGGKGEHCGGNGAIRKILFREPMTASILSNRRALKPFGLKGGCDASAAHNYIQHPDGSRTELSARGEAQVAAGDIFVIETPGGGGFGTPSP